jgi:rSAM/selenodomain-associated transferase 2
MFGQPKMPESVVSIPELSVIVPILNEAERIEQLLLMLARQEQVHFEVILSDGNSTDDTLYRAAAVAKNLPYELHPITGDRGRGKQLNNGASAAQGTWLLFLHADSDFPDQSALWKGLDFLKETVRRTGQKETAGRFALTFDTSGTASTFGYSFCEGKARLNRPGCILGDQGFLLSREFFQRTGLFNETLPLAEDLEFAERIRIQGKFLLLPAEIRTSSRRFRVEGYRSRQTLNALLMGLLHSGQSHVLARIPGIYQSHDTGRRLQLEPFFRETASFIATLAVRERLAFWYRIGTYVRANAWQLAFALDVRRALRLGIHKEVMNTTFLAGYDRHLDFLTDHPPGKLLTAGLVKAWFFLARNWAWLREGKECIKKRGSA